MTHLLAITADGSFADDIKSQLAGIDTQITVVATLDKALHCLTMEGPDCIVSDGQLPETSCTSFLRIVRVRDPALPILIIGDDDDKMDPAQIVSAGATEYIHADQLHTQRDQIRSLIDTVVSAARTREALGTEGVQRTSTLSRISDPVAIIQDGDYEYVNDSATEFFGATNPEDFSERPLTDIFEMATTPLTVDQFESSQTSGQYHDHEELTIQRSDGETITCETTIVRIEWEGDPALAVIVHDSFNSRSIPQSVKDRVLDVAPIGVTIADAQADDTPVIFANDGFEQLTGYSMSEIRGQNCRFLQGKATSSKPVATLRKAIDAGEATTVELRNYRKNGEQFWNRVTVAPIEDDTGQITHYVGFQQDVTDRKEREQDLRHFKQAVEHAGHSIIITDTDGRIEYVNPAFERITGYTEQDALGTNPRILKSGEHDQTFYEELWSTILDGEVWHAEIINERKDGEQIVVDQTIAPVFDDTGEIDRFVGVYRDITNRKKRERELERYRKAVEQAGNAVMITDREGTIEYVNAAFETQTGYDREEVNGRTPQILKSGQQDDAFYEVLWETILSGEQWEAEIVNQRKSGKLYAVDQTIAPVRNVDGAITHFVAIESDISDRQLREQRIAVLNRILRHNLRNALTVIEGRARQLAETVDEPNQQSAADAIVDRTKSLAEISEKATRMNELLQRDYKTSPTCDLSSLLEDCSASLRDQYPQAEISIEIEHETPKVNGDCELIELAIVEMIENAVEHHDRSNPSVTVTVSESISSPDHAIVRVADDGPGIPEHERAVIESGDETPLLHGDSVGLWTIRWVATVFGGEVTISENDPRGSIVTISLPLAGKEPTVEPSAEELGD